MCFEWYKSKINPEFTASLGAKTDEMYRSEIRRRLEIFKNLGHSREHAVYRVKSNFAWEFENSAPPAVVAEIDSIADSVFS